MGCENFRGNTNGDIVNWNEAEWSTKNIIVQTMDMNEICQTHKRHILLQGRRTPNEHKVLCNSLNGTISTPGNTDDIEKLAEIIKMHPSGHAVKRFWTGWSDEEEEGVFINVDTGLPLSSSKENWYPGEPNGGALENCIAVKNITGRMYDFPCHVNYHGLCYITSRPRMKIRGEMCHFQLMLKYM